MAYCGKCGTQMEDGKKFCPTCGAAVDKEAAQQADFSAKLQDLNNTADETAAFAPEDIAQHKVMGILAYFGPLVLIPIFAAPGSRFARYHSNQGLVLLLAEIAYSIVYSVLSSVILAISWRLYFLVNIVGLIGLVFLVLAAIGIINAANGRAKELPVIGKLKLLK